MGINEPTEAEIDEDTLALARFGVLAKEDVGGLDVAMDDAPGMGAGETFSNAGEDSTDLAEVQ